MRDAFDNAIHTIYAAALKPEQWPAALGAVADCFGSVGTALLLKNQNDGWSTIVSPALAAAARDYEEWGWKLDFLIPRAMARSTMAADACYTDRQLATVAEITHHPFYTQFRHKHGLGPFLGTQVFPAPDLDGILTMQGRRNRDTFTDDEMETYGRLARHVERALMLTVRLYEADTRARVFADALGQLSGGLFCLDETGRIVFMNSRAGAMLGRGLVARERRLSAEGPSRPVFAERIKQTLGSGPAGAAAPPPKPLLLEIEGESRIALYFIPAFGEEASVLHDVFSAARVIVLALEHSHASIDPQLTRDLLGLSPGEARLVSIIGAGRSPRDAAALLGITEESARTLLKRVFQKTGTSRQSELASVVARLVFGTRHP